LPPSLRRLLLPWVVRWWTDRGRPRAGTSPAPTTQVTTAMLSRIAGAAAALSIPLVPKCPLCLLPLAAAAGVTLPSKPLLDLGVGLAASAWAALVLASRRPAAVTGIAAAAALLLVAGRAAGFDLAVWAGAAGMLASAFGRAECERPQSPLSSSSSRSLARAIWSALR
jgi:hypothetical protein